MAVHSTGDSEGALNQCRVPLRPIWGVIRGQQLPNRTHDARNKAVLCGFSSKTRPDYAHILAQELSEDALVQCGVPPELRGVRLAPVARCLAGLDFVACPLEVVTQLSTASRLIVAAVEAARCALGLGFHKLTFC